MHTIVLSCDKINVSTCITTHIHIYIYVYICVTFFLSKSEKSLLLILIQWNYCRQICQSNGFTIRHIVLSTCVLSFMLPLSISWLMDRYERLLNVDT